MTYRRKIGPTERRTIARAWENRCAYCETSCGPFDIEHIVPHSEGGPCEVENLCYACRRCNQRKAATRLPKFYEGLLLSIAKRKSIRIKVELAKHKSPPKTPQAAVFGEYYVKKYMTRNTVKGCTQAVIQEERSAYCEFRPPNCRTTDERERPTYGMLKEIYVKMWKKSTKVLNRHV